MTEIDVEIGLGPVRAIPVTPPVNGQILLAGPGRLMGWSFREAGFDQPQSNEGQAVAPAAGATIVQIANPAGDNYTVQWSVQLIGAAAAADQDNFALFVGATQLETSLNAGAAGQYPQTPVGNNNQFGSAYAIKAIGAGTAGVTYAAQLAVTPVAQTQAAIELQDGNQPLTEIAVAHNGAETRWFGPQGIYFCNRIQVAVITGNLTGVVYAQFVKV